jgi:Protein of unknown function (DUF669)
MDTLNLAGADTSGFDAIPSGKYAATVFEVEPCEVEGADGKLPQGTPGYNVKFRVEGGEYDGRFLWNRYWLPGDEYDATKGARMKGMFVNLLVALGHDEKKITSGSFKLDVEDLTGRECVVQVGQYTYDNELRNNVKGVKPAGEAVGAASSGLL